MMKLLLGLDAVPSPHDVADALAVAICHLHTARAHRGAASPNRRAARPRSWRDYRAASRHRLPRRYRA